jgi:hypothetical protein
MPRISKYQLDGSISNTDKLLGSDEGGNTRNFKILDLSNYFAGTAGVYKHHQNSAAAEWTVNHDLDLADYLPHVTVKMSGGAVYPNIQGMGMVTYVDKDNLKINFVGAHSGYAYLKK